VLLQIKPEVYQNEEEEMIEMQELEEVQQGHIPSANQTV
jgi:hypothetical protein